MGMRGLMGMIGVIGAALLPLGGQASEAPAVHLQCELQASNERHTLRFLPTSDPYRAAATPIGRSFRFKAVLEAEAGQATSVRLYAYAYSPRQYVLLHMATYDHPTASRASLTGQQRVYSPRTGSELLYQCTLLKDDTP
jgi:hypothetical protein